MGDGELPALAAALRAKGPAVVLVTEGSKGVTAFTNGAPVQVAAQPVEVADTVGAGDTFNAGFLAGLDDQGLLSKSAIETPVRRSHCDSFGLGRSGRCRHRQPGGRQPAPPG